MVLRLSIDLEGFPVKNPRLKTVQIHEKPVSDYTHVQNFVLLLPNIFISTGESIINLVGMKFCTSTG